MKRIFWIITLIGLISSVSAQDTIRITHSNYVSVFSTTKHYPVLVEWWLTKSKVQCSNPLVRTNNFAPDPDLSNETDLAKDYSGQAYDRGHMSDAADNLCLGLPTEYECFYYSNMAPQYPALNRGSWKKLEMSCRKLAIEKDSIHIWAGNLGEALKIGKVSVPLQCWKVIYVVKDKNFHAYLFTNSKNDKLNLHTEVPLDSIKTLTGFKF